MKVLVTGGLGFVGTYLAQYLYDQGHEVFVSYLSKQGADSKFLKNNPEIKGIRLDVSDFKQVHEVVSDIKPEEIYHLAALTFIPEAEKNPDRVFQVNTMGSLNVFRALLSSVPQAKVLMVSSSELYGIPDSKDLPLSEDVPLKPMNNYGLSKAYADLAAQKYFQSNGLQVYRARPFTHVGAGQNERFVLSSFSKQLACIKLGLAEPVIKVGNLDAKRDISAVSDFVRGYCDLLKKGQPGVAYNFCSGQSHSIRDLLEMLMELSGVEAEVIVDPERVRPVDIPDMRGSYERAKTDFDWEPIKDIRSILKEVYDYWEKTLS